MKKGWIILVAALTLVTAMPFANARHKAQDEADKIIFIPHDNRPISDKQTADVVRKLGYDVVVPPDEILGNRTDLGHPDALWQWLDENAKDAKAAVVSSDSMLYGSLVGSRKHEYSEQEITDRAERFTDFRKKNPRLPLYVFGSIMRTPRTGEASGHEEPG